MPRTGLNCYVRSDGRWCAVLPPTENPEGKRLAFYGTTKQEALSKRKEALRRIDDHLPAKQSKRTLSAYLDEWLECVVKPSRSAATYEFRALGVKHLKGKLGKVPLEALTPAHLRRFYREKSEAGLKNNTIQCFHSTLNVALGQAVKDRILRENVARLVSPPSRERGSDRHFCPSEAQRFIECAKGEPYGLYFILLLLTGLRKSELRLTAWEDVDFEKRHLRVRGTKTKGSLRTVPLMPELLPLLRAHKPEQQRAFLLRGWEWKPSVYLFTAEKRYGPMGVARPNQLLVALLKKHGFAPITVHQLRHSAASLLFEMGADPKEVQEILGHATLGMTMDLYTHLLPERKQAAVDRLSALFKTEKTG